MIVIYYDSTTDATIVFQYTYQVPGEENKEYVVLWDYNVGLVRMTPFFKSLKHSKVGKHFPSSSVTLTSPDHTGEGFKREFRPQGC